MSTALTEGEAPAPPADERPRHRRLAGRVGAGVLAVAVAAGAVGLGVWETTRDELPGVPEVLPTEVPPPMPPAPDYLASLVNTSLLADPTITPLNSGLTMTAEIPEWVTATDDGMRMLAAHVNVLLRENCLDNLSLVTENNLRISLWGFCHSAIPDEDLAVLLEYAQQSRATELAVTDHPAHNQDKGAMITWMPATAEDYDAVLDSWEELEKPDSLIWVSLIAHGTEEVAGYMDYADLSPTGITWGQNSQNPRR